MTGLDPVAIIGFVAAALSAIRTLPQWRRARRDANVDGVSGATWALACASGITWTAYSVAVQSWPLILGTGLALAGSAGVFLTLARRGEFSPKWVIAMAALIPITTAAAFINPDPVGWTATALSLTTRVPQLVRTARTRSLNGLSRTTWVLSAVASGLWVIYGALEGLWPVVLADGWALACAIAIIALARPPRNQPHAQTLSRK